MRRLYHANAYAPRYDPGNFWNSTVEGTRACPPLAQDVSVDVAIVGAGFTGLNAALGLAEAGERGVAVFDAAPPGWGASGRNGGFVCVGGVKLSGEALLRRYGLEETRALFAAQTAAIDTVAGNLERYRLDVDRHGSGEWQLAHRPGVLGELLDEQRWLREHLGVEAPYCERAELAALGMAGPEFHGALHLPYGFAINPRKYLDGLLGATLDAGVPVYGETPVTAVHRGPSGYELTTPRATVRAAKLLIATNGYSADGWIEWLSGRYLPAVSTVTVTRPLDDGELAAQGWSAPEMAYDSRNLLHYFRLMPDRRFLFGMRGAVSLSPGAQARTRRSIRRHFERMFPAWRDVETPWTWSGLVCLTRDRSLYVGPLGDWPGAWAAFAYHGNGVAMGSYCGRLLADLASGRRDPREVPAPMRNPPRRFPLPRWRLNYLRAAYAGMVLVDR